MRIETTPWIVLLLGWAPLAMAGLVQDHHHIDAGYTPFLQQPLGTNPLRAFSDADDQAPDGKSAAPQTTVTAPAALADCSPINFAQSGTTLAVGQSLLEAYAPRLDSADPLPLPPSSFSDGSTARSAEMPVGIPLPPLIWPALITLLIGFRKVARATSP